MIQISQERPTAPAERIRRLMSDHIGATGEEATVLFMRPAEFRSMVEEFHPGPVDITKRTKSIKFMGLRVIRSKDLKPNEIIVA